MQTYLAIFNASFAIGFGAGGAVVWFFKDKLVKWYMGAEAFAKALEAKATALKSAVK